MSETFKSETNARGDFFVGTFVDGVKEGFGTMLYSNGDKYEGHWSNNMRDGPGTYQWANGDIFEGTWCENQRVGQGKITFSSKEKFEGFWRADRPEGLGFITSAEGNRYIGSFIARPITTSLSSPFSTPSPIASLSSSPSSSASSSNAAKDRLAPRYKFLKHGLGEMHYANGDKYFGEWSKDKREGFGVHLYFKRAERYYGLWRDDKRHGTRGMLVYDDGTYYEGEWAHDVKDGRGTMYFATGDVLQGTWRGDATVTKATFTKGTLAASARANQRLLRAALDRAGEGNERLVMNSRKWDGMVPPATAEFVERGTIAMSTAAAAGFGTYPSWEWGKACVRCLSTPTHPIGRLFEQFANMFQWSYDLGSVDRVDAVRVAMLLPMAVDDVLAFVVFAQSLIKLFANNIAQPRSRSPFARLVTANTAANVSTTSTPPGSPGRSGVPLASTGDTAGAAMRGIPPPPSPPPSSQIFRKTLACVQKVIFPRVYPLLFELFVRRYAERNAAFAARTAAFAGIRPSDIGIKRHLWMPRSAALVSVAMPTSQEAVSNAANTTNLSTPPPRSAAATPTPSTTTTTDDRQLSESGGDAVDDDDIHVSDNAVGALHDVDIWQTAESELPNPSTMSPSRERRGSDVPLLAGGDSENGAVANAAAGIGSSAVSMTRAAEIVDTLSEDDDGSGGQLTARSDTGGAEWEMWRERIAVSTAVVEGGADVSSAERAGLAVDTAKPVAAHETPVPIDSEQWSDPFEEAIQTLRQLPTFKTPRRKLKCLIDTSNSILACIQRVYEGDRTANAPGPTEDLPLGAEDKFPVFVYVVIKANLPNLIAEMAFCHEFTDSRTIQQSESGYRLTELESAVEFIEQLDPAVRNEKGAMVPFAALESKLVSAIQKATRQSLAQQKIPRILWLSEVLKAIAARTSAAPQIAGGVQLSSNPALDPTDLAYKPFQLRGQFKEFALEHHELTHTVLKPTGLRLVVAHMERECNGNEADDEGEVYITFKRRYPLHMYRMFADVIAKQCG